MQAHYRVLDGERLTDVVATVPFLAKIANEGPDDDWFEFAILRKPKGPRPPKEGVGDPADLIANFMIDDNIENVDLYARSRELMQEARAILEVLCSDALEFKWERPYTPDSPRDKKIAQRQRRS